MEAWRDLWDEGKYDQTYKELSNALKTDVNKKTWAKYWTAHRNLLGKIKSRKLIKTDYRNSVLELPGQEGLIFQFQSSFENKDSVIETIALIRNKNGSWQVSHYMTDQIR